MEKGSRIYKTEQEGDKKMLIKSLIDEMILEFFNYLEQSLSEMILSMLRKEKHLVKIGLWGHKKEKRALIEKIVNTISVIIEK